MAKVYICQDYLLPDPLREVALPSHRRVLASRDAVTASHAAGGDMGGLLRMALNENQRKVQKVNIKKIMIMYRITPTLYMYMIPDRSMELCSLHDSAELCLSPVRHGKPILYCNV